MSHALLDATMRGLGGERRRYFRDIFQCKQGVNQAEGEPNYDLFLKAVECSSRRLYPNFVNVDASFNLVYYKPDEPDTIIATMAQDTDDFRPVRAKPPKRKRQLVLQYDQSGSSRHRAWHRRRQAGYADLSLFYGDWISI